MALPLIKIKNKGVVHKFSNKIWRCAIGLPTSFQMSELYCDVLHFCFEKNDLVKQRRETNKKNRFPVEVGD